MVDTDNILQGILIGGFAFMGISTLVYCLRKKRNEVTMKKSASTEELNSVSTDDPQS